MRRRELLAAVAAVAAAPSAFAQAARVRVVGYLSNGAGKELLSKPLAERGYVEGRNLRIELRLSSEGEGTREAAARELVGLGPDVLVAYGAANVNALARQTTTIPIVCGGTADPIGLGYAKTLRRPGGNITGLSFGLPEMAEMIVGLMGAVRPELRRISAFVQGRTDDVSGWSPVLRSVESAAQQAGFEWAVLRMVSLAGFEQDIAKMDVATSIAYVVSVPGGIKGADLAAALARRRMASSTTSAAFVREGLLMQYSIDHADRHGRVAGIVDSLLRGARAAETPFELPDRTTFTLNRLTARKLGIDLPASLLTRATEIVG